MNTASQTIINASAHELPLPDKLFHSCVTSPPYFSLRRYEGEQEIDWPEVTFRPFPESPPFYVPAQRAALGLERDPTAYIGHLVLCFREVRRTLRDDGVCWVIMGDSYSGGGGYYPNAPSNRPDIAKARGAPGAQLSGARIKGRNRDIPGLQQGDLMLIPHRLALALQGDGWIVRNDCVWSKKSPMPESVSGWRFQDGKLRRGSWRHTRAHETVIMAVKSMGYYADQERVREASSGQTGAAANFQRQTKDHLLPGQAAIQHRMDREPTEDNGSRNPRSVLTPRPSSYSGSHYATFPPDLIAPLIRASVPTRCCPVCGAPWAAVVERTAEIAASHKGSYFDRGKTGENGLGRVQEGERYETAIKGYQPTCDCGFVHVDEYGPGWYQHDPVPGICLDNFAGTFTTGAVCAELGVNCVGVDVSAVYLDDHAKPRIGLTPSGALDNLPLFAGLEDA